MFPFLKIFGNENGTFRGTPGNFAKRWVFSWVFTNWSKVAPRGWVFSLSFLLEFCHWVLVFSAADVKKKPALHPRALLVCKYLSFSVAHMNGLDTENLLKLTCRARTWEWMLPGRTWSCTSRRRRWGVWGKRRGWVAAEPSSCRGSPLRCSWRAWQNPLPPVASSWWTCQCRQGQLS